MKGTVPNISHLRTFGGLNWTYIQRERRKKLGGKSEPGILVGCYENKQYKVWIPSRRIAIVERDVIIDETDLHARDWSDEGILSDTVASNDGGAHVRKSTNLTEYRPVTVQTLLVTTTQQTVLTQTNQMVTDKDDQPSASKEATLEALTHYTDQRAASQGQEGEQE